MSVKQVFTTASAVRDYDRQAKPAVDVDLSHCSPDERPRMISLINRLAKSKAGFETLQIAADGGYEFHFIKGKSRGYGYCDPENKCVALNPSSSDDKLVGTLCHECRHAGQFIRGKEFENADFNVQSQLLYFRAMEADAQTYAVTACDELNRQGDAGPLQQFYKFYPEIAKAHTNAMEKSGGRQSYRMMTDVFKGWYDQNNTKTSYEEGYQLEPMQEELRNMLRGAAPTMMFSDSVSCQDTVRTLAWTKEGNYFVDDPQILMSGKYMDVSERSFGDMCQFFSRRQELTGDEWDETLRDIPTRPNTLERRVTDMKKVHVKKKKTAPSALKKIMKNKQNHQQPPMTTAQRFMAAHKLIAAKNR